MILSFADAQTAKFWLTGKSRRRPPSDLRRPSLRKLLMLDRAASLDDLRALPGNRLETLKGARKGQYSLRINDQFRICFRWQEGNTYDVEITDYHS